MLKIFQNYKKHWLGCIAVVALLIVQAWCDLALPSYTSDIVDVGIQQGGIQDAVMDTVRADTLDTLMLLMEPETAQTVNTVYYGAADAAGVRALTEEGAAQRAAVADALTRPAVGLYMIAQQSGVPLDDAAAQLRAYAAQAGREAVAASAQQASALLDEAAGSYANQYAAEFVKQEYAAQGIDLDRVQMKYLWGAGGKMILVAVCMTLSAVLVGLLASRISAAIGRDLRTQVYNKVVSFSSAELDRFSTASLITRSTNDIQQVQMVSMMLLRMVAYAPIVGIGGVIKVMETKTGLSWIIGGAVGALLALVMVLYFTVMPKFKQMQKLVDRLNLVSRELLTGVMPIRAFSREAYEEQRFDGANRDLMSTQLFTNRVMAMMSPVMNLIMYGVITAIVWFGGKGIDAGTLQVGDMIAFISYTMQIVMSFLMLAMVFIMLPRAGVAADRIDEVLRTEPAIHDPAVDKAAGRQKDDWNGVVQFHDVSFRYPGADDNALEHISFTARPGETTAIIGSTGCGKSTLLHLIPRFYDVTEGSVTVDGIDVRDMKQSELRALLGYVPQKGVLFSGDIESNLKFGGASITDEAMQTAAGVAQAAEFIEKKTEGYHSPIAQGGTNVSGGQKQRLSIARAIAKDPKIYLFDDSFSALDYKTDVTLRKALHEHVADATVIIVAQRISTVLHANQILVLDDGRVVGAGTHAQLLATCPEYREIARSQLSEKELALNPEGGEQ